MKTKVLVKGPVLTLSGYGEHARFVLRALKQYPGLYDVYIIPTTWGQTGWLAKNDDFKKWIDETIHKTVIYTHQGGQFDISMQVTIPDEWVRLAPINIGVTAGIETTQASSNWIQKINEMDEVIVTSQHAKNIFVRSRYTSTNQNGEIVDQLFPKTNMEVISYPVLHTEKEHLPVDFKYDFNYLLMAQWSPRKNIDNAIKWWIEENYDKQVGLIIKANHRKNNIQDRDFTEKRIKQLVNSIKFENKTRMCSVTFIHGDLTQGQLESLYQHPKVKVVISTTHGEGFGLPLFEAAYNGVPVIATGWSGHEDFLNMPDNTGRNQKMYLDVNFTLAPIPQEAVWDGVLLKESLWAYPDEVSFKNRLSQVKKNYSKWEEKAEKLQKYLEKTFTESSCYEKVNKVIQKTIAGPQEETQIIYKPVVI